MKKIGLVSFTDPRIGLEHENSFESELKKEHLSLVDILSKEFEVVNPHENLKSPFDKTYGVRSTKEMFYCVEQLMAAGINGVVLGLWKWSDPYLCVRLIKELNIPAILYTRTDPDSSGATFLAAVASSIDELGLKIEYKRLCDKPEGISEWANSLPKEIARNNRSSLLDKLHRSSILLWGGSYCLRMDVLQDDIPKLKSFLIGDILQEDQYVLIQKAEMIYNDSPEDVEKFLDFLKKNGAQIVYGGKLNDVSILKKQISFYLAAKKRLEELKDENIIGVSIKCQPEFSEIYGVTACTLPAFLPFAYDHEGKKDIMPTVCEGDIKGLLTSAILHTINPEIPPLFGDLKTINDDYFIISNCGASSAYYAGNSNEPNVSFRHLKIQGQCQGKMGGAIGYTGLAIDKVTVARLVRIKGEYKMHIGIGKTLNVDDKIMRTFKWGNQWPHVAISLNSDKDKFMDIVGSNHYCLTVGDHSESLEELAREISIPVIRIDNLR